MVRMTLHEAQTAVTAIRERNNLDPNGWAVRFWDDPIRDALKYTLLAADMGPGKHQRAAQEIAAALIAYYAHLAFEAGRAFSDAATIAYVDAEATRVSAATYSTDGGAVLTVLASELRDGLHYAEPKGV